MLSFSTSRATIDLIIKCQASIYRDGGGTEVMRYEFDVVRNPSTMHYVNAGKPELPQGIHMVTDNQEVVVKSV
jgi:hypothetical protein